ncbi:hypothetical protein ACIPC1_38870 [Streptomyces sp. NPDC087263]|uniref:hypothetical protein n=1 Tax=Streptomyces sp. NPDC087263 TaxID=3365773 RepID=UPI003819A6D8
MMLLRRERRRAPRAFFPGALCAGLLGAGCGGGERDGKRSGGRTGPVDSAAAGGELPDLLTSMQGRSKEGLFDPDTDDKAFTKGRGPISGVGHWMYGEYTKALPGEVRTVPLPDFGEGTVTGTGS